MAISEQRLHFLRSNFRQEMTACPPPLPHPVNHKWFPDDPTFQPSVTPFRGGGNAQRDFQLNPFIVMTMLSQYPEQKGRPVIDWFASTATMVTRSSPPENPWAHQFAPPFISMAIPKVSLSVTATEKFLAEGAQGCLVLLAPIARELIPRLTREAARIIRFAPHPDNILEVSARISTGRTCGVTIFLFCPPSHPAFPVRGDKMVDAVVPAEWNSCLPVFSTPLRIEAWRRLLGYHPDGKFVNQVLNSIEWGWALQYKGQRAYPRGCTNPRMSHQLHTTLRALRHTEMLAGWRTAPFTVQSGSLLFPLMNVQGNPTQAVTKSFSDKVRHVVNSSYPYDDTAVNANIDRSSTRLWNADFAILARHVHELGPETLLLKFDICSAYKQLRLMMADFHLLAECEPVGDIELWSLSTTMSFGASSSADVWHELALAFEFICRLLLTSVSGLCRYSDDLCAAIAPVAATAVCPRRPDTAALHLAHTSVEQIAKLTGLACAKYESGTSLVFLGTGICTTRMVAFIAPQRLLRTIALMRQWSSKKRATQKQLQSLAGTLGWLCQVVHWGRPQIRTIIRASSHRGWSTISSNLRNEAKWWVQVLSGNPVRPLAHFMPFTPDFEVHTDASAEGYGAYCPHHAAYIQGAFTHKELRSAIRTTTRSMGELELRAVLFAVLSFLPLIHGCSVLLRVDNQEAVTALNKRWARPMKQNQIIQRIGEVVTANCVRINCIYFPTPLPHLPTHQCNRLADFLSRAKVAEFLESLEADCARAPSRWTTQR